MIRAFFATLNDREDVTDLYHSQALSDPLSIKERRIREHREFAITSDFERLHEDEDRIVIRFERVLDDSQEPVVYELRTDDGDWRLFEFGPESERDMLIDN